MKHGDKVTFRPRNTRNLRSELRPLIGKQLTVQGASWFIEEDDGTPYTSEQAISVRELPFWIPSGDLSLAVLDVEERG